MSDDGIAWYAGLDWGGETHCVCLLTAQGGRHAEHRVAHGGAGLAELCRWLCDATQAAPAQIAVAIETSHGPVVDALLAHGLAVYSLNPKQLDRFRDRFTTAGAKDDRRDALVLASALRTDRHAFRQLAADDPRLIQLREVTRMADELKRERGRLTNRLREQLWRYFPQMLQLPDELHDEWFLTLWRQAPTPAKPAPAKAGGRAAAQGNPRPAAESPSHPPPGRRCGARHPAPASPAGRPRRHRGRHHAYPQPDQPHPAGEPADQAARPAHRCAVHRAGAAATGRSRRDPAGAARGAA